MAAENEPSSVDANAIRVANVLRMAQQFLERVQVNINEAWEDWRAGNEAATDVEIALALAISTGVANRIANSTMNEVQVDFARQLADQYAIVPVAAETGV